MKDNNMQKLESQLYFNWIDDLQLKSQLTKKVKNAKAVRTDTQKELTKWLNISLTKIKEIENGSCKDFNAINNYINFFQQSLII